MTVDSFYPYFLVRGAVASSEKLEERGEVAVATSTSYEGFAAEANVIMTESEG